MDMHDSGRKFCGWISRAVGRLGGRRPWPRAGLRPVPRRPTPSAHEVAGRLPAEGPRCAGRHTPVAQCA
ncbi:hypothetical protein GCM10018773_18550 [Streptomyces candidus]|nr:hypothetical protein GCM10018773_18550 [Streptomyces candidus]